MVNGIKSVMNIQIDMKGNQHLKNFERIKYTNKKYLYIRYSAGNFGKIMI